LCHVRHLEHRNWESLRRHALLFGAPKLLR
jgi:hypothetical protein